MVGESEFLVAVKSRKDFVTTVDSVWLPSMTEYFGRANNNIMEGEQFEWFKTIH